MKRITVILLVLVLLLAMTAGCGSKNLKQFEKALENATEVDITSFFASVEDTCDLAILKEESYIDTDTWTSGVLCIGYQSTGYTIAGYETTISLSVNSGFITGVDFTFKGITEDDFEAIAAAAEEGLGEADRSGETIITLLWSNASMIYQSGASSCEFLIY